MPITPLARVQVPEVHDLVVDAADSTTDAQRDSGYGTVRKARNRLAMRLCIRPQSRYAFVACPVMAGPAPQSRKTLCVFLGDSG